MAELDTYRRKRDFAATPEPAPRGRRRRAARAPAFVVQRHAASHLHFDFRLEWDGVLKSWAVPKGPSLNPKERRLAVEVEDHPLDYADFSGTVPEGQYGAGAVTVWDRGTWQPEGDIARGFEAGKLEFTLQGRRLRGRWVLVRTAARGRKPSWLLIKRNDEYATAQTADIAALQPASLDAEPRRGEARVRRGGGGSRPSRRRAGTAGKNAATPAAADGRRPGLQLATLVDALPRQGDWFAELKLDGYRLLVHADRGAVHCWTRNGKDWTARLPGIAAALRRLNLEDTWLDGELVSIDERGQAQFRLLQQAFDERNGRRIDWVAFDVLKVAGVDVRDRPLRERKRLLRQTLAALQAGDPVRVGDYVEGGVAALWRQACRERLEGLILKDPEAPYVSGRTPAWLKLKCRHDEEFVVGGYTRTGAGRPTLTALLLGLYEPDGRLRFIGRAGSGFDAAQLAALRARLDPLRRADSPFAGAPKLRATERPQWVEPRLVVQVRFAEWTDAGLLRQPTFLGVREDRDPREIRAGSDRIASAAAGGTDAAPPRRERFPLTHPQRVLFADDGITKAQLDRYYDVMQEALWPQLERRMLSLLRSGGQGKVFVQRHGATDAPQLFAAMPTPDGEGEPYLRLRSAVAIGGLAQLGVVELHTGSARAPRVDRADRLVFDLDPDPKLDWQTVRTGAVLLREMLAELGLRGLLKTSGGAGLHVVVPLAPAVDFGLAADFSARVARHLARLFPERFTATRGAERRRGKTFIDWQRNQREATTVAAWSPRWRRGAPVSVPLDWDELGRQDLRFAHFNLQNAPGRFLEHGQAWAAAATRGQRLTAAMRSRVETLRD
jgi:bifunctional non-homologous end joining protein LigD